MGKLRDQWQSLWGKAGPEPPPMVWRVRVDRERSAIGRLNDRIEQTLASRVPDEVLRALQVALDELLTNVVMHARHASGPVEIELTHAAGALHAKLNYIAAEFDPTAVQGEDVTSVADSRIGGLGLLLVRSLMDEVRYEYVDGCNVLHLRKRC